MSCPAWHRVSEIISMSRNLCRTAGGQALYWNWVYEIILTEYE
jgi:hypothetical protein